MEVLAQLQHFKDALNASLQEEFDALLQKEANADELAEFSSKLDEPLKTEFNALLESLKEQKQEQTQNTSNSDTQQKKPKAKTPKQKRHFIDIVSFEYLGEKNYEHRDEKGKKYIFHQGDTIFLKDDESARYFAYKNALFKKLC
ncbi:hypothetical protein [Campylobacter cuniculorum]|uniref:Uncharacterized protein n=2 Tax=Campylobacter cuniculorum TaxID=374106 RepID=A0A1W6BV09_9BACT|nr:hypothetical protein [Campylobacter cuniculorum]ARJ55930.1 hypothetical protein CCUN_0275 [Campylobacter cuniculorum DSM 23162 = LMG 24588]QOR05149.1 hypothetical protein A0071_04250 [Campylobacter cuniculorum]